LVALLVLSACATNDSALELEQTESPATVESTELPATDPIDTTSTLLGVETGMKDSADDTRDQGLVLPRLLDSILIDHPSSQQPLAPTGDMPPSIIASTEACEMVMVDSATGEKTILWKYQYIDTASTPFYYCEPLPEDIESILPPNYESGPSYIEDLEWIDSGYILISMCCEPAVGRFELLAMPGKSETEESPRLALHGRFPNISDDGSLVFVGFGTIGYADTRFPDAVSVIEEFGVSTDDKSHPEDPRYKFTGEVRNYGLYFNPDEISSDLRGHVGDVSWLDNDRIAFDLWSFDLDLSDSGLFSWIGVIDLTQQSVSLHSRSPGWSNPTGDGLGNLVVAEQSCNSLIGTCELDGSRIVTVDSQTLLPVHELEVDGEIADMDLVRGWLLVTLTDGRMGTVDFATGEFSVIADGITHAVWMD